MVDIDRPEIIVQAVREMINDLRNANKNHTAPYEIIPFDCAKN